MSELTTASKSNGTSNQLAGSLLHRESFERFNVEEKYRDEQSAPQTPEVEETSSSELPDTEIHESIEDFGNATDQFGGTIEEEATSEGESNATPDDSCEEARTDLTPEKLIGLADNKDAQFFHDQHGDAFAWFPTTGEDGHFECLRITSQVFKARLLDLAESVALEPPQPTTILKAIELAKLKAFRTKAKDLANRHKSDEAKLFIDLGDDKWKMVTVSGGSWSVQPQDAPRFLRNKHQLAMKEPEPGGDPFELFKFVSVDSEEEKVLVLAWTLGAFFPAIPLPMLIIVGPPGSAKTTRSRRLRSLLDPSVTPVLGDMELSNLFLTFHNHAVPCFENVSKFTRKEADMFCRAVTGNGVERRKMFTDSDQVLYSFRRPIIINGIDTPSIRPDFLDRSVIINCRRMEQFKTLKELDCNFEEARPRLFGALLDLLAKTLNEFDSASTSGEFRMADFARFGRAMASALGKEPKLFDNAYRLNVRHQDLEILEATPMVKAVTKFAARYNAQKTWEGTADELLTLLHDVAYTNSDHDAKADLPKSPRWLSSRLSELVASLASEGVVIERLPRTNKSRGWKIYSTTPWQPSTAEEAYDNTDLIDFMSGDTETDQDGETNP